MLNFGLEGGCCYRAELLFCNLYFVFCERGCLVLAFASVVLFDNCLV